MNDPQVDALRHVAACYRRWGAAHHLLDVALEAAANSAGPPPIAELQSDYLAQKDVVRAALEFADTCAPNGPELTGLSGPAFVLALFMAAKDSSAPGALADLDTAMAGWWQALATVPSVNSAHPPRPSSAPFNRTTDAANNWIESLAEHETDVMIDQAISQGAKVTRIFTPTVSAIRAEYPPLPRELGQVPDPIGTLDRDGSLAGHLARMWRAPLRAVSRNNFGQVDVLSTHWTGGSAWRAAHKARLAIDPKAWIELWEWTFRGYKLVDVLPFLDPSEITDDDHELVHGILDPGNRSDDDGPFFHSMGVIGLVRPSSRGWTIAVRVKGTDEFRHPPLFESYPRTLATAKASIQELYDRQPEPQ